MQSQRRPGRLLKRKSREAPSVGGLIIFPNARSTRPARSLITRLCLTSVSKSATSSKSRSFRGTPFRKACLKGGAGAVPAGGIANPHPGGFGHRTGRHYDLARKVLAALAPGGLPFAPGKSRKRGPELSQGVRALASAAAKRRKASAPRFGALPRSCTFRSRHLIVWRGQWTACAFRRSASLSL